MPHGKIITHMTQLQPHQSTPAASSKSIQGGGDFRILVTFTRDIKLEFRSAGRISIRWKIILPTEVIGNTLLDQPAYNFIFSGTLTS
jgi:hypothetical protein